MIGSHLAPHEFSEPGSWMVSLARSSAVIPASTKEKAPLLTAGRGALKKS